MVSTRSQAYRSPNIKKVLVANNGVLKSHKVITGYKLNFGKADQSADSYYK